MSIIKSTIELDSPAQFRGVPCIVSLELRIKSDDKIQNDDVKVKKISIKSIDPLPPSNVSSPMLLAGESRYYLNVPIGEKDAAKILGAKWDNIGLKWYIQLDASRGKCARTGNPISSFARWDPRVPKPVSSSPAFKSPESVRRMQHAADVIEVSSDSDRSSEVSPKRRKNLINRSPARPRVCEDEDEGMPKSKKLKRTPNVVSSDDEGDSFIVDEEELSPSDIQALEKEKLTIGRRCYGCAALDVPHVCAVEDCFKDSCVMHVVICKACKNSFCDDHGKSKHHDCKGRGKKDVKEESS
jgi:hypothetical protein